MMVVPMIFGTRFGEGMCFGSSYWSSVDIFVSVLLQDFHVLFRSSVDVLFLNRAFEATFGNALDDILVDLDECFGKRPYKDFHR